MKEECIDETVHEYRMAMAGGKLYDFDGMTVRDLKEHTRHCVSPVRSELDDLEPLPPCDRLTARSLDLGVVFLYPMAKRSLGMRHIAVPRRIQQSLVALQPSETSLFERKKTSSPPHTPPKAKRNEIACSISIQNAFATTRQSSG